MPFCNQCGAQNPDGSRFCSACGQPLGEPVAAQRRRARKTVTIVFSDIAGSTDIGERLDPESINNVMRRYSEEMSAALERHGGTVEKFIGDAVMAVFGVPVSHEDDALRAVGAAAAMRASLELLNAEFERRWGVRLQVRTGVNTGEVVSADPSKGHGFVTGDAVNVAARLETAAGAGEIFLGHETWSLVRDAVDVEPVGGLELKGKAEPVPAYRLIAVNRTVEGVARRIDSPLVGRAAELARIRRVFEDAADQQMVRLATVIGAAGQGKSRLVHEFASGVSSQARVLQGRCLPYGEGITFWPIAEVTKAGAGITENDTASAAEAKLRELMPAAEDRDGVVAAVASLIGLSDAPLRPEEVFWAVRKLLEGLAAEQPLVVVFDDIHWGEDTFLDLLEYLAGSATKVPMLILCLTRPEIGELRPALAGGELTADSIELLPLSAEDSRALMQNLLGAAELPAELSDRLSTAAEGNPLFVEEMLRMLVDEGLLELDGGRWQATADLSELRIPATIEALLTARLDKLAEGEQDVIEGASVIGQEFWSAAVCELLEETDQPFVGSHLQTLMRKQLVARGGLEFAGERAYRFGHILIRDVAYLRLLKESRAQMHERFANWLAKKVGERMVEYEEIVGYHLEQAFRYREELGPIDDQGQVLAALAAARLGSAGIRAHAHGDVPGAAKLLERALALMDAESPAQLELMIKLGQCLFELGEPSRAEPLLDDTTRRAVALGDRRLELRARVELSNFRIWTAPELGMREASAVANEALDVFEAAGDEVGLACALINLADVASLKGRSSEMGEMLERALVHATRAGDQQTRTRILPGLAGAIQTGPTPADAGIARLRELLADVKPGRATAAAVEAWAIAVLEAMRGNADEGRRLSAHARAVFEEFGQVSRTVDLGLYAGRVELFGDDPQAAEQLLRRSHAALIEMGDKTMLATVAAELAECLYMQERFDEAMTEADRSAELADPDDVEAQVLWRVAKAKSLASTGSEVEAERLAREAVTCSAETDQPHLRGTACMTLADVAGRAGRWGDSFDAAVEAVTAFEQKGNVVCARRAAALRERAAAAA
jgi:class 3 adenylate cyclase/tetratricopeptide (TPR) repeat protein